MIQLIERANHFKERTAIKEQESHFSYARLLQASEQIALSLLQDARDLEEARVAFLVPAGFTYACIQWGVWRAGGIAVPLCEKHPLPSIRYVIEDTGASVIVYSEEFESFLDPLRQSTKARFIAAASFEPKKGILPEIALARRAMILYTSGTTGLPKGVVSTHQNIQTQITCLVSAWDWQKDDHALNLLPLHHVHGIINLLGCALWSGACCEFIPGFSPEKVFDVFCEGKVNVFMAVPTIYYKLIAYWQGLNETEQQKIGRSLEPFRLMVSGSAALPVSVLEEWREVSGHTLLERYGMTEMGMAISNPYRGERKPGYIGQALPGVMVRIVDEEQDEVANGTAGEIQVKGPNVFSEYWNKPRETADSFTEDGWFKTGDIAVYENGSYRILGRNSVDIIKSGGYKISALEIEEVLRTHPKINDCGVVGIPDQEWGELVGACLVVTGEPPNLEELGSWLKERLPAYKIPRTYIIRSDLPRNVMGKVTKKALKSMF
jgi:malonyl-CoA/methylmalonyl-CoA synthetase